MTTTPPLPADYGALPQTYDPQGLAAFAMVDGDSHPIAHGAVFSDGRVVVSRTGGDVTERHTTMRCFTREWVCRGFLVWCAPGQAGAPRRFVLRRNGDPTGVSGTGYAAEGVQWPHGGVHLMWLGTARSLVEWPSIEEAMAIHGHGGATALHWLDPA